MSIVSYQPACDCQSEARALGASVAALEGAEEPLTIGERHARALVGDFDPHGLFLTGHADVDRCTGRGMPCGVFDEIGQDLVDLGVVTGHQRQILGDIKLQRASGEDWLEPA